MAERAATLLRPPDWATKGLCVDETSRGHDWWCPDDDATLVELEAARVKARRICGACPVRVDCLVDAISDLPNRDLWTMRAGLTPTEITRLAADLGLPTRRRAMHGTRSRYVAGCRCPECRDAHRRYEHHRRLWAKTRRTVFPVLLVGYGRGRRRACPGQYLLTSIGLPDGYVA